MSKAVKAVQSGKSEEKWEKGGKSDDRCGQKVVKSCGKSDKLAKADNKWLKKC